MKKLFALLIISTTLYSVANAQCDKDFKITASKTQYVDSTGKLEREKLENSSIEITGIDIKIIPGEEDDVLNGKIKTVFCNWKVPFKEGKSIIKTELGDKRGEVRPCTITLEGKDGQVIALLVVDDLPNRRIRLTLDSFKEK